jgi:hypothetical protein
MDACARALSWTALAEPPSWFHFTTVLVSGAVREMLQMLEEDQRAGGAMNVGHPAPE